MIINFDMSTGSIWHTDCTIGEHSSPMVEAKYGQDRTLMECVGCGKQGYYPIGKSGCILVEEENINEKG